MEKQDFIREYKIKDALPISPMLRVLPAEGVAMAIEDFINERFRGVAHARASVASYGGVLVSVDYLAYFFKALLSDIYGRAFLEISITNDNKLLNVTAESEENLPLQEIELRNLIRIARSSGAKVSLADRSISLSFRFEDAAIRQVYAISVNDGRRTMLSKLGELFYCGEELDPSNPPTHFPKKPQRKPRAKKQ